MASRPEIAAGVLDDVAIRRATKRDLSEVVAMERECYPDPWPASAFANLPGDDRVFFVVARRGPSQALVGYAIAWFVLDEGELANLAVAPTLRCQGMGRRLLDATTADAVSRGTSQLYLEVRESNAAARHLYTSSGFAEVGRRKGYYRKPVEDALILRRTLR